MQRGFALATLIHMIGENIRQTRTLQKRSLADVAKKAKISVATLSRIENGKQALDVDLLLTLAQVLGITALDLLGRDEQPNVMEQGSGLDPLVKKITAFESRERTQLWRELANAERKKSKSRRAEVHQLGQQVEELLAHIEFIREELESVRKRLRR